ncbi:MAG: hypothetical protein FWD96_05590 [Defluviitaleaceae bacterium]|nr:hypothetical protein [Defluviitaleaceae bacterium]
MERTKSIVSIVGTLLMIASFVFIGMRIALYDIDFSVLSSPLILAVLVLLAFIAGLGYFYAGIVYQAILEALSGVPLERGLVVKVYCIANLYKYIPGSVMYAAGRNRLVFEVCGLSHTKVALATMIEIVIFALAGLVVSALFAFDYFVEYMRLAGASGFVWVGVGAAVLLLTVGAFARSGAMVPILGDFSNVLAKMPKLLGAHVLILFVQTATYPATLILMGQPLTLSLIFTVVGLYALSWLIGFLTLGAPSGLGIREAVLLMFLGGVLDEGILLSSIVIHRAMGVAGDVFVYGVALAYHKVAILRHA